MSHRPTHDEMAGFVSIVDTGSRRDWDDFIAKLLQIGWPTVRVQNGGERVADDELAEVRRRFYRPGDCR